MYTLEDVSGVANFIIAYEESQQNQDSHFLICRVSFVSKIFSTFIVISRLIKIYTVCYNSAFDF